jgi:histidinol-phosphate aminotransferase
MTTPHLRDDLASMPAYKAGATPKAKPGVETFKVSANENPYAPIPAIVDAITKAAQSVQRYPDPASIRLRTKLANKYKVGIENIQVGTGSVAVLTQLIQASSTVGNEVIFAWRSFEAYPIITKVAGATPVMIPLTNTFHYRVKRTVEVWQEEVPLVGILEIALPKLEGKQILMLLHLSLNVVKYGADLMHTLV